MQEILSPVDRKYLASQALTNIFMGLATREIVLGLPAYKLGSQPITVMWL